MTMNKATATKMKADKKAISRQPDVYKKEKIINLDFLASCNIKIYFQRPF